MSNDKTGMRTPVGSGNTGNTTQCLQHKKQQGQKEGGKKEIYGSINQGSPEKQNL